MSTAIPGSVRPILVLGLGNLLLMDDGFGPALVERLRTRVETDGLVELVDGGTMGMGLLGLLDGRRAVILLDAFRSGSPAGTLSVYKDFRWPAAGPASGRSAHEGNAASLLAAAALTGDLPEQLCVIGIEPAVIATGIGLSTPVAERLAEAEMLACQLIEELREAPACV
ncbi:MAG: hydrogenase maturation protease [Bryobacteraceae bacterium]|nr:hydrogenase maturation protease [Bryobacteraceae bacterium]